MSNERGERYNNHDNDKKDVPIWDISEDLSSVIRELSNAAFSAHSDECGTAGIEE